LKQKNNFERQGASFRTEADFGLLNNFYRSTRDASYVVKFTELLYMSNSGFLNTITSLFLTNKSSEAQPPVMSASSKIPAVVRDKVSERAKRVLDIVTNLPVSILINESELLTMVRR
jgi:hypothetical protein